MENNKNTFFNSLNQLLNEYNEKINKLEEKIEILEKKLELGVRTEEKFKYLPKNNKELIEIVKDENIYLGDIDTSLIQNMSNIFLNANREDYSGVENSKWNTDNVKLPSGMFKNSSIEDKNKPLKFQEPKKWYIKKDEEELER